jgi:hypothetical protein
MVKILTALGAIYAIAWFMADKEQVRAMQPGINRWAIPLAVISWTVFLAAMLL